MKFIFSFLILFYSSFFHAHCTVTQEDIPRTQVLSVVEKLDEDYAPGAANSTIELKELKEPQQQQGLIKKTATVAAQGLLNLTLFTTRVTGGTFAVYYLSQSANLLLSKAAFTLTMYYSQNAIIANMVYIFGISTCLPITSAVVFYLGYRSPDIIYYSGKTVIKVVQFTGRNVINLAKGTKLTCKHIADYLSNDDNSIELIELVKLNQPENTAQITKETP